MSNSCSRCTLKGTNDFNSLSTAMEEYGTVADEVLFILCCTKAVRRGCVTATLVLVVVGVIAVVTVVVPASKGLVVDTLEVSKPTPTLEAGTFIAD